MVVAEKGGFRRRVTQILSPATTDDVQGLVSDEALFACAPSMGALLWVRVPS